MVCYADVKTFVKWSVNNFLKYKLNVNKTNKIVSTVLPIQQSVLYNGMNVNGLITSYMPGVINLMLIFMYAA